MAKLSHNTVSFTLSRAESLVLFDSLSRYGERKTLKIKDQAENRVLDNMLGFLEKQLDEPFAADYVQLLETARKRVRNSR